MRRKRGLEPLFATIIIIGLLVAFLTIAFSFGNSHVEEKPESVEPVQNTTPQQEGEPAHAPPGVIQW